MACAEGLNELGFSEKDSILFWADNNAETLSIVNGSLELGLSVIDVSIDNEASLKSALET